MISTNHMSNSLTLSSKRLRFTDGPLATPRVFVLCTWQCVSSLFASESEPFVFWLSRLYAGVFVSWCFSSLFWGTCSPVCYLLPSFFPSYCVIFGFIYGSEYTFVSGVCIEGTMVTCRFTPHVPQVQVAVRVRVLVQVYKSSWFKLNVLICSPLHMPLETSTRASHIWCHAESHDQRKRVIWPDFELRS